MRDLLNILDQVLSEATISKYPPGSQFAVSDAASGKELKQLMQQQGFDYEPPLFLQDINEFGEEDLLNMPTIMVGRGGDGYLFKNNKEQFVQVVGSASTIHSMFNHFSGVAGGDEEAKVANRGEIAEGILGAAMFAKFAKREGGEEIGTVTPADIAGVLDRLKKTGQDEYEVSVKDADNQHADKITYLLKLKSGPYRDLMDPAKRELLKNEFNSAAGYVNSSDAERYSRYFYINGKADEIVIAADGAASETERKTDVWVYVKDENGQPRKLRLNASLKVGGIGQFGQVGGDSDETQQTLWNYFGIDVSPYLSRFSKLLDTRDPQDAFEYIYKEATKQLNNELKNASPEQEASIIDSIAQGVTHFATLGDPQVELVDFDRGGFKVLRFNNLVDKLRTVNLEASYRDDKKWPEVVIHERGNPKNKLLNVRVKIENRPKGLYIRNIVEKGPLLEKLTEFKKAKWSDDSASDDFYKDTKGSRLTGPGVKAAKSSAAPKDDEGTLGRRRR